MQQDHVTRVLQSIQPDHLMMITNTHQTQWVICEYNALGNAKTPIIRALYEGSLDLATLPNDHSQKCYTNNRLVEQLLSANQVDVEMSEELGDDLDDEIRKVMTGFYANQNQSSELSVSPFDVEHVHLSFVRLWILRMLIKLGGHREFINPRGFRDDEIAEFLSVSYLEASRGEFNMEQAKFILRQKLAEIENDSKNFSFSPVFTQNLAKMQAALGFSELDTKIFAFVIHLHSNSDLDNTADFLGFLTADKLYRALSIVLDEPEQEINKSMSNKGLLARSGVLKLDRDGAQRMRGKIDLITSSAYDLMMEVDFEPLNLLRNVISESQPTALVFEDYPHFSHEINIILPYFKHAIATGKRGVNFFLYGAPGTGKTEFVRCLAQALSVACYEVTSVDGDGDPINGQKRLSAYASAQNLLKEQQSILMFDEVEDIFVSEEYGRKSAAQASKAWFNHLLEMNSIPTIWISNRSRGIDPAFIRRFDLQFEMPIPSKSVREKILTHYSNGLLSAQAIGRFAKHDRISPAVVERAIGVIAPIAQALLDQSASETNTIDENKAIIDQAFERVVNQTMNLQGHRMIEKKGAQTLPDAYHLDYMNTSTDMGNILAALKQHSSARICLYGPPGTGKTAYGHYLSQQLDKPLLLKKASDLLSMWVGGTEENMAKAFREAEEENAILLIDEVDSFISNRDNAVRSWEVTAINEMLTQMESYNGIFIATTNRMDGLDPAALRRFDIKIKVDYLNPEQLSRLFAEHCQQFNLTSDTPCKLEHLNNITPGDFAAIRRQHKFNPVQSVEQFVTLLEEESKLKQDKKGTRIGF